MCSVRERPIHPPLTRMNSERCADRLWWWAKDRNQTPSCVTLPEILDTMLKSTNAKFNICRLQSKLAINYDSSCKLTKGVYPPRHHSMCYCLKLNNKKCVHDKITWSRIYEKQTHSKFCWMNKRHHTWASFYHVEGTGVLHQLTASQRGEQQQHEGSGSFKAQPWLMHE